MQCCSNFELALLAWTLPDQLVTKPQLILLLRYHHLSNTCLFHFRSTAYWQRSMRLNNLIWPPVLEWRAILPLNTSIKANLSLMRAMPGKKIRLLISLRYVVYFYVVYRYIMLLFQVFVWLQIVLYASDVAKINYVDKIIIIYYCTCFIPPPLVQIMFFVVHVYKSLLFSISVYALHNIQAFSLNFDAISCIFGHVIIIFYS